jgi:ATP-dependent Clp protease protease subunit
MIVPNLITTLDGKEVMVDFFTAEVTQNRTIRIIGEITDDTAAYICSEIRYLSKNSKEPLTLILNSPGGSISAGMAIYDTLNASGCEVTTVVEGMAASMAAFLATCAATKGRRFCQPNAEIMVHQPLGGVQGQASDISIAADHINSTKKKMIKIFADSVNLEESKIKALTDRDTWLSAEDALKMGFVDYIGDPMDD